MRWNNWKTAFGVRFAAADVIVDRPTWRGSIIATGVTLDTVAN